MSQMTRREQNRLEKQARIMSAALTVFSEAGYSGASMDVIAAQAGLTKPTLYHHFESKKALFQAMMSAQRDLILLAFETAPGNDLVDHLLTFAWKYADTVMQPRFLALARLTIGEAHRFPEVGRAYQASGPEKVLSGLMALMVAQRDLGRLSFDDEELAAEDFWGLILSAPRNRALHEPDTDVSCETLARYINNGIRTFLRAYSTNPAADLGRLDTAIAARSTTHSGTAKPSP